MLDLPIGLSCSNYLICMQESVLTMDVESVTQHQLMNMLFHHDNAHRTLVR